MAQTFVDDVWFGGVAGVGRVSDVLSGMKAMKGESVEEGTRVEETCGGAQGPGGVRVRR